jgi:hypothetical protein
MSLGSGDLILIDSRNRNSGSTNSLNINLNEPMTGTYELTTFSIVNNFYNVVNGENDKLYFTHSVQGVKIVTLTSGNYTFSTIVTMLTTVMDSSMSGGITFAITYSATTGKLTFVISSGTFQFTFETNSSDTCRFLIGKNSVDDSLSASQIGDNPIDLILHKHICIKIAQDSSQSVTLANNVQASLIIPIDSTISFGSLLQYNKNKNFNQYLSFGSTGSISILDIDFFSNDGDSLSSNAAEWSMTLKQLFTNS